MEKISPIDPNSPEMNRLRLQRKLKHADELEAELVSDIADYETYIKEDKANNEDAAGTEESLKEAQEKLQMVRKEKQKINEDLQKL